VLKYGLELIKFFMSNVDQYQNLVKKLVARCINAISSHLEYVSLFESIKLIATIYFISMSVASYNTVNTMTLGFGSISVTSIIFVQAILFSWYLFVSFTSTATICQNNALLHEFVVYDG